MDVRVVRDAVAWDAFVLSHGPRSGAFLHAFGWGAFQEGGGDPLHRLGFYRNEELVGVAAFSEVRLPFGQRYLFCPRGPIFTQAALADAELLPTLSRATLEAGRATFLRFEPPMEGEEHVATAEMKSVRPVTPPHTLILSLADDTQTILAKMHHKTRYNIRLAEKKGIQIEFTDPSRFFDAWPAFVATAERDGFRLHAKEHYEAILTTRRSGTFRTFLALATVEGEVAAANLMVDFGDTRTYLHGASMYKHRASMAPYLLHWRLIEDAKAQGLLHYDWWGIAGSERADDPWAGITRFKLGFGGERVAYPGTFDLILDPARYQLYTGARTLARKVRATLRSL